jgi:hypothetical protein
MRSVCIIGLVCLLPAAAHASAESTTEESKTKHELLERRVFLPSLIGFGAGTPPLVLGSTGAGFAAFPTGIVSYFSGESSTGGQSSRVESFAFDPSIDVRVGRRWTIGGGISLAWSHSVQTGAGDSSSTTFELAPRIGYLVPLAGELYLWPRLSAGALFGEASAPGFPTSSVAGMHFAADVLLVAGLGSHFFLTIGPHGSFTAAWQEGITNTSFGIGANVGLGVAL